MTPVSDVDHLQMGSRRLAHSLKLHTLMTGSYRTRLSLALQTVECTISNAQEVNAHDICTPVLK